MFADNLVADTRCTPAVALDEMHDSDAVSLEHVSFLFNQDDYGWTRQVGGPQLERDLRRGRYRSVLMLLDELQAEAQVQLESWRRVAADSQDYSSADPVWEMIRLRAGLVTLRAMAWWRIRHGWPAPEASFVVPWCRKPMWSVTASTART